MEQLVLVWLFLPLVSEQTFALNEEILQGGSCHLVGQNQLRNPTKTRSLSKHNQIPSENRKTQNYGGQGAHHLRYTAKPSENLKTTVAKAPIIFGALHRRGLYLKDHGT